MTHTGVARGAHKSKEIKQGARRFGIRPQDRARRRQWARPKQLLLIPHRLAIALQDDGWLVRNDNVWVKPNPVPDQVRDRCSMSHEYVFHLTNESLVLLQPTAGWSRNVVGQRAAAARYVGGSSPTATVMHKAIVLGGFGADPDHGHHPAEWNRA